MEALLDFNNCHLCPRNCGINRNISVGFCGCGSTLKAARAALHHWEEPCISGTRGSGAVFFSGCTLKCCFCQNHLISQGTLGKELSPKRLEEIFLSLQEQGAHNIDLITATQFLPQILPALDLVKHKLHIPVIYNCGGYEKIETLALLKDYIDIYLPDLKYFDSSLSWRYSKAKNYFEIASEAIPYMIEQTGELRYDAQGILQKGVIIRHMVLPGCKEDSIQLLHWIKENLPKGNYLLSLLSSTHHFTKAATILKLTAALPLMNTIKSWTLPFRLALPRDLCRKKAAQKKNIRRHLI